MTKSFAEFAAKYATVRKYLRTIKKDLRYVRRSICYSFNSPCDSLGIARSFWFAPDSNALCVHPTSDITAEEMPTPRPSPSASSAYRAPARELSTLWVIAALDQEGMPSNNRRLLGCLGLKVTLATDDSDSPEVLYWAHLPSLLFPSNFIVRIRRWQKLSMCVCELDVEVSD